MLLHRRIVGDAQHGERGDREASRLHARDQFGFDCLDVTPVAGLPLDERAHAQCVRVAVMPSQYLLVAGKCRVVLPRLLQRIAETVLCLDMVGVDRDRIPQACDGRIMPADALQRGTKIEVDVRIVRIACQRVLEARDRRLRIAHLQLRDARPAWHPQRRD